MVSCGLFSSGYGLTTDWDNLYRLTNAMAKQQSTHVHTHTCSCTHTHTHTHTYVQEDIVHNVLVDVFRVPCSWCQAEIPHTAPFILKHELCPYLCVVDRCIKQCLRGWVTVIGMCWGGVVVVTKRLWTKQLVR